MQYARYVFGRLLLAVPTLLLVTFGSYVLLFSLGDPASAIAGESATREQLEQIRENLGLDQSVFRQYWNWLVDFLHGNLGRSFGSGRPVSDLIEQRLPVTASLGALALVVAVLVSIPLAFLGARHPGTVIDRSASVASVLGLSIPNFFLGLLLTLVFAVRLGWFPATGYTAFTESPQQWLSHLVLPAITLGLAMAGEQARTLRTSLAYEMSEDYIRTARAKNVPRNRILFRHAGRNAGVPLVTVIGLQIGRIVAGAVLVEAVFAIPGIGSLISAAVFTKDLPVVQAVVALTAVVVILLSLLVDLAYGWLTPSARSGT